MYNPIFPVKIPFIHTLTFFTIVSGFLFGYDTGVISGALILLNAEFNLTSNWQSAIVSVTMFFAAIFSLFGGIINQRFGRRLTTIFSTLTFILGTVFITFSRNKVVMFVGRAVLGMAIGVSSMTAPMYIAECAPAKDRGRLVTLNNVAITFGQFSAAFIGGLFAEVVNGWRWMFGLALIPMFIQLFGYIFVIPESPRWLLQKNRFSEAKLAMKKIRENDFSEIELQAITISKPGNQLISRNENKSDFSEFLLNLKKMPVQALLVGCMLQVFQQLSGINTVMYYSATIMKMAGVTDSRTAIWQAAQVAFANFLFGLISIVLVDRLGRRKLAIGSMIGIVISLSILSASFRNSVEGTSNSKLALTGMILYLLAFSPGMGPLPWTVNSEIYPDECSRNIGNSVATFVNWIFNFLVSVSFLPISDAFGRSVPFVIYCLCSVAGVGFIFRFLPETKGVPLEKIGGIFGEKRKQVKSDKVGLVGGEN